MSSSNLAPEKESRNNKNAMTTPGPKMLPKINPSSELVSPMNTRN